MNRLCAGAHRAVCVYRSKSLSLSLSLSHTHTLSLSLTHSLSLTRSLSLSLALSLSFSLTLSLLLSLSLIDRLRAGAQKAVCVHSMLCILEVLSTPVQQKELNKKKTEFHRMRCACASRVLLYCQSCVQYHKALAVQQTFCTTKHLQCNNSVVLPVLRPVPEQS